MNKDSVKARLQSLDKTVIDFCKDVQDIKESLKHKNSDMYNSSAPNSQRNFVLTELRDIQKSDHQIVSSLDRIKNVCKDLLSSNQAQIPNNISPLPQAFNQLEDYVMDSNYIEGQIQQFHYNKKNLPQSKERLLKTFCPIENVKKSQIPVQKSKNVGSSNITKPSSVVKRPILKEAKTKHPPHLPPASPSPVHFESQNRNSNNGTPLPSHSLSPTKTSLPKFYTVKVSEKPVFLRRTTIRPPTLETRLKGSLPLPAPQVAKQVVKPVNKVIERVMFKDPEPKSKYNVSMQTEMEPPSKLSVRTSTTDLALPLKAEPPKETPLDSLSEWIKEKLLEKMKHKFKDTVPPKEKLITKDATSSMQDIRNDSAVKISKDIALSLLNEYCSKVIKGDIENFRKENEKVKRDVALACQSHMIANFMPEHLKKIIRELWSEKIALEIKEKILATEIFNISLTVIKEMMNEKKYSKPKTSDGFTQTIESYEIKVVIAEEIVASVNSIEEKHISKPINSAQVVDLSIPDSTDIIISRFDELDSVVSEIKDISSCTTTSSISLSTVISEGELNTDFCSDGEVIRKVSFNDILLSLTKNDVGSKISENILSTNQMMEEETSISSLATTSGGECKGQENEIGSTASEGQISNFENHSSLKKIMISNDCFRKQDLLSNDKGSNGSLTEPDIFSAIKSITELSSGECLTSANQEAKESEGQVSRCDFHGDLDEIDNISFGELDIGDNSFDYSKYYVGSPVEEKQVPDINILSNTKLNTLEESHNIEGIKSPGETDVDHKGLILNDKNRLGNVISDVLDLEKYEGKEETINSPGETVESHEKNMNLIDMDNINLKTKENEFKLKKELDLNGFEGKKLADIEENSGIKSPGEAVLGNTDMSELKHKWGINSPGMVKSPRETALEEGTDFFLFGESVKNSTKNMNEGHIVDRHLRKRETELADSDLTSIPDLTFDESETMSHSELEKIEF